MDLTIQQDANRFQTMHTSDSVQISYKKVGRHAMLRIFSLSLLFLCMGSLVAEDSQTVSSDDAKSETGSEERVTCDNVVPPDCLCKPCEEHASSGYSIIDYVSFNHIHEADDYATGEPSRRCNACGGGVRSDAIEPVNLKRIHRFRDMSEHSSFSPGVFQKYDISLRFAYKETIKERQIFLFDPNVMARYVFLDTNNDGVYTDGTHNSHKNITLYTGPDGTGTAISDFTQAQSAVLTTQYGHTWSFSLHNLANTAPAPWLDQDLGEPNYQGYVQWYDAQSGVIAGGGQLSDGVKDEGRALYQAMNGDASISVALTSFTTPQGLADESTKASAQAAATLRAGLDTGSMMAAVGIRKDGQVAFTTRAVADAARVVNLSTPANPATHVKIDRVGTVVTGYYSSDAGVTWISAGSIDLTTLGAVAYVGVTATGDDVRVLTQVAFSELTVTGTAEPLANWPVQNNIQPHSEAAASNGDWVGRLESQLNRNGYGIHLNYKSWTAAELLAAPDRIWQLDTVADDHGRTLTYYYDAQQVAGHWVISAVDFPNGSSVTYTYANGQLAQINHADGAQSTFTITDDAVSQCQVIDYDDAAAEGTHRRKSVYLSNNHREQRDANDTLYNTVINQSSMLVRLIINAENEVSFLMKKSKQKSMWWTLIYEGTGKLRAQSLWSYGYYPSDKWSWDAVAKDFVVANDNNYHRPTLEPTFAKRWIPGSSMNPNKWSKELLRKATPKVIDDTGIQYQYTYNSADLKTKCTYPDGSFETWAYNSFNLVTRYRDRLGRVTKYTYDSQGNKLSQEVGLLDVGGSDVAQAEHAITYWSYYPAGHANEFLLATTTDANGNQTSYAYDAQNQLISITEAPDHPGDAQAVQSFVYDSAGRLISSSDALGRTTQYSYDVRDRVMTVTYADGSTERTVYGTSGQDANLVLYRVDRNGSVTSFTYDAHGRRIQTTTGAEVADSAGVLSPIADPSLRVDEICTFVAGTNDLKATCERSGELSSFTYDYRHRLASTTRQANTATALTSTRTYVNNLLLKTTDAYGRDTYYNYRDSDRRRVRTITATKPSFQLADFTAVAAQTRDLSGNAAYLISDVTLDAAGQAIERIDARGTVATTSYDSRGRVVQQVAAAFTGDTGDGLGTGRVAVSSVSEQGISEYIYDANSNVIEVRSPRYFDSSDSEGYQKAKTTRTYTGRNLLASETVAAGTPLAATRSMTYFLDKRLATETDFRGNTKDYAWGTCCARPQAVLDPALQLLGASATSRPATITRHNDFGDRTHEAVVTDYDGSVFPTFAQPANVTDIPDADTVNEITTRYDERHRPVAQTIWLSPRGAVDANNPPIAGENGIPAGDGLTTRWTYDDDLTDGVGLDVTYAAQLTGLNLGSGSDGSAVAVTNPENETSVMIYDGLGRVIKTIDALGNTNAVYAYDSVVTITGFGDVVETSVSDALGHTNKTRTDGAGRRLESEDAEQHITTFTYDAASNLISYRDPNGVGQDCVFDARDRDVSCTDTQGDTTSRIYDANNNVITATDALAQTTDCVFDARDRKITCTDRINATTTYAYDANNNLLTITDAEGSITTYVYDVRNLLELETFPTGDAGTTQKAYAYDAARRLVSRLVNTVEAPLVSETTNYVYDAANRLTTRAYPDETGADDVFTYDAASRLLTAVSNRYSNTVTRGYDAESKLTTETLNIDGTNYTITYAYDVADRQTVVTYPNGKQVVRSFTDRNQLQDISYDGTVLSTSVYDNGMRETNRNFNNGVQTVKTYRSDNLISDIDVTKGGTNILDLHYTYDANKRKLSETDALRPDASQTFNYDNEDRLTTWGTDSGVTNQTWSLSAVGDWDSTSRVGSNPIVEARSHTDVHEVTAINGNALTYDFKGNLATNAQNSQDYIWDAENRMQSIGNSVDTDYRYDALGRRVQKSVTDSGTTTVTTFVCGGAQVFTEYINGLPGRTYVYHGYVDEPIAIINILGDAAYYHQNHLFSVEVITDNAGALVETYDYDSHGKMTIKDGAGVVLSASSVGNAYGFTGRRLDVESGLYYFRARYFDVGLGRFIARDGLRYFDGLCMYSGWYIPNALDPTGYFSVTVKLKKSWKYMTANEVDKYGGAMGFARSSKLKATYSATCVKEVCYIKKKKCQKACFDTGTVEITVEMLLNPKFKKKDKSGGSFDCDTGKPGDGENSIPMDRDFIVAHEEEHARQFQEIFQKEAGKMKKKCPISCRKKIAAHHMRTCVNQFKSALKQMVQKAQKNLDKESGSVPNPKEDYEGYVTHPLEQGANRAACIQAGKVPGF